MAPKSVTDMSEDSLWKAMICAVREPAECGLEVDGVTACDMIREPGTIEVKRRLCAFGLKHSTSGLPIEKTNLVAVY